MSNELEGRVRLLKTIADATRLRILGLLAAQPHTGRELADALGLTAPTVSHHMQRLVEVGIVNPTPDATRRVYALNAALLAEVGASTGSATAPTGSPNACPRPGIEDAEHQRTVRIFFDGPRLRQIPAKRKARVSVLLELLRLFEPGRVYTEAEVNALLREAHEDFATLRRELVDYRYLTRESGEYRVASSAPERDANEAQEVPAGESAWLGALIRGAISD